MLALERGLLALADGHLLAAEKEFAAALDHDPASLPATINLAFTSLSLGRLADAVPLLARATAIASVPSQARLLKVLHHLAADGAADGAAWTIDDDRAVVSSLRSIGRLDSVGPMFDRLVAIRGQSPVVKQALAELVPLRAKDLLDRGDPAAARALLDRHAGPYAPALVRNLLGICACLYQDFPRAVRNFQNALPPVGDDARVQQNLALARGWAGDAERSVAHWRRFLELQSTQMPKPPGAIDYHHQIAELVMERLKEPVAVS